MERKDIGPMGEENFLKWVVERGKRRRSGIMELDRERFNKPN